MNAQGEVRAMSLLASAIDLSSLSMRLLSMRTRLAWLHTCGWIDERASGSEGYECPGVCYRSLIAIHASAVDAYASGVVAHVRLDRSTRVRK